MLLNEPHNEGDLGILRTGRSIAFFALGAPDCYYEENPLFFVDIKCVSKGTKT